MSLEEKIRAYAAKGELVHLSLASRPNGGFECSYVAASPAGGYAYAEADDPVDAIEAAFKASPARPARVSKPKYDVTAAVNDRASNAFADGSGVALSEEWTAP